MFVTEPESQLSPSSIEELSSLLKFYLTLELRKKVLQPARMGIQLSEPRAFSRPDLAWLLSERRRCHCRPFHVVSIRPSPSSRFRLDTSAQLFVQDPHIAP